MFESIANFLIAGIFLSASATGWFDCGLPANTIALPNPQPEAKMPQRVVAGPTTGVKVTAESYIVVEPESGAVLYEKNATEPRAIASITKLMTVLTFLEYNPGWDKEITMLSDDFRSGATPVLSVGDKVTVKDLFYATLVASSNEAANALARSTGLKTDDFVFQMNVRAKLLEMKDSKFIEPTGLSDDNHASAEDIVKLIRVAFTHSEVRKAGSTKTYTVKVLNKNTGRNLQSTDKILKEDFGVKEASYKIEAGKTGFTNAAGYCFASQVKDDNNRQLLIAVLGSSSTYDRFTDTKALAYWVFNNYQW
jgi:D-alanyl-D-alanine carboxypeptidase